MLTDSQWDRVTKKYQRLIYAVAHRIGGDRVANSFEDSTQELAITVLDAVDAYSRKTKTDFDEFFGTIPFDKYIKTCLWNKKNNLGNKIKKKYGIRNNVSLSANPDAFATQTGSTYASSALEEEEHLVSALDDVQLDTHATEIAEAVLGDMRIIKPDGSLNISKLSRLTNQSKTNVRRAISRMEQQLQDYDNEKNN